MTTTRFISICILIFGLLVWFIYVDDKPHRDKASLESARQYRMHESPRVKRTSAQKDIFVTRNFGSQHKCGKMPRSFDIRKNITVEMKTAKIKGIPSILPPTYPIVQICKFKKV